MFESELRVLAGIAYAGGNLEVPISMWGFITRDGRFVVLLVLPPGANAVCERTYCEHDAEHYRKMAALLSRFFGLRPCGNCHHHHRLGLDCPSCGDLNQVRSFTSKTGHDIWCDILTTTHDDSSAWEGQSENSEPQRYTARIRLHAIAYSDPQHGTWHRTQIQVLPGTSPIRLMLMADGRLDAATLGQRYSDFPWERMDFDRYEPARIKKQHIVLEQLAQQLSHLPAQLQETITLRRYKQLIRIGLATNGSRVIVAVDRDPPHAVRRVKLQRPSHKRPVDVTSHLVRSTVAESVDQVFAKLSAEWAAEPWDWLQSPLSQNPQFFDPTELSKNPIHVAPFVSTDDTLGRPPLDSGSRCKGGTQVQPPLTSSAEVELR
jgi:hypothetical protein